MNRRSPTVTLSASEGARLREILRVRGDSDALRALGIFHLQTLYRAAAERPIAAMTAEVIRGRLDRI